MKNAKNHVRLVQKVALIIFIWFNLSSITIADSFHFEVDGSQNNISDSIIEESFNKENTKAIIIIQDDSLLLERYYSDNSKITNLASPLFDRLTAISLMEIALNEGYIYSMEEPVRKYLPELSEKEFSSTSLSQFLNLNQEDENYPALNISPELFQIPNFKNDTFALISRLCCLVVERATGVDKNEYFENRIIGPINNLHYPFILNGFKEDSVMISCCNFLVTPKDLFNVARLFLLNGVQNSILIQKGNNCLSLSKSKKLIILWIGKEMFNPDFYEFSKKLSDPG